MPCEVLALGADHPAHPSISLPQIPNSLASRRTRTPKMAPPTHTKAYLNAILGPRASASAPGSLSPRPPASQAPIGTGRTSFESSRSSQSTSSRSDEPTPATNTAAADDEAVAAGKSSPRSTTSTSTASSASTKEDGLTPTDRILRILNDVDEDDQPDQLKDLLGTLLPGAGGLDEIVLGLLHRHREDQHPTGQKFDLPSTGPFVSFSAPHTPTTGTFNPTPGSSPIRAPGSATSTGTGGGGVGPGAVGSSNLSRSGSLRKSTHNAATLALQRSNSGLLAQMATAHPSSRPASPSPLGRPAGAPSLARAISGTAAPGSSFFFSREPSDEPEDAVGHGYSSGGEGGFGGSASGKSPYGSPRLALHAGATEFRPKSAAGLGVGSAPGSRARSPIPSSGSAHALFPPSQSNGAAAAAAAALNLSLGPTSASSISRTSTPGAEGRNVWAFNPSSPLGTPKFVGTPLGSGALTPSRTVSDSYFGLDAAGGTNAATGLAGATGEKAIPRDPWKDEGEVDGGGGVDPKATVAALEAVQKNGGLARLRLGGGLGRATSSSGGDDEENELDLDPFSPFARPQPPKITTTLDVDDPNAFAGAGEEGVDNALEWGMSPAMAREMERFSSWDPFENEAPEASFPDAAAAQQQRSRSGQGHPQLGRPGPGQAFYAHQGQNLFGGPVTPGGTSIGPTTAGYTMTPFDELYASVAGTGITPEQMEEALARCAFDPVEAMDWLIQSRSGPGGGGEAGGGPGEGYGPGPGGPQRFPSGGFGPQGGGPPPGFVPQRARFNQASGNRPTLITRDSFDRRNAAAAAVARGGGHSPMGSAPSSPRWGSRPLTPTGEQKTGGPSNRVWCVLAASCAFALARMLTQSD